MLRKHSLAVVKPEERSAPSPIDEIERRVEELFRRPFSMMSPLWDRWPAFSGEDYSPAVDVYEEGNDVVVKAEIPGMKKDDIHVELGDRTLTISGEKRKEEKVERKDFYRLERSHGSFVRTFALPAEVEADKVRAKFADGVLEVRIPKTAEAVRKSRKVEIE